MKRRFWSDVSDKQLWSEVISFSLRHQRGVSSRRRDHDISSHWVEEQSAVLSLCSSENIREWWQAPLWQGTTSPQVTGDNLLVQTQLGGDALKRLWIKIQDGHRVGERRRSGGNKVPKAPLTEGAERRRRVTTQEEQSCSITLTFERDPYPSSSSSSSLLGTSATMMEQSFAVMATRYWWTWSQSKKWI